MMLEQTFGEFLTGKRKERELSLREFARRMGISPVYVCNIEKNRRAHGGYFGADGQSDAV